jgi:hypothetical protein
MTINELIAQLETIRAEYGDIEVLHYADMDQIVGIGYANVRIAEDDEFPDDWNMPEGFTFVELGR